jgi:hypothetical protein
MNYTAPQKLKRAILIKAINDKTITLSAEVITAENVDELFVEHSADWALQDEINEMRYSGQETGLPERVRSRHYESDEVAAQMDDGSWVGWTFWHGGGKHSEPDAIDWIPHAYDLDVTEEQKVVTVRTFTPRTETA